MVNKKKARRVRSATDIMAIRKNKLRQQIFSTESPTQIQRRMAKHLADQYREVSMGVTRRFLPPTMQQTASMREIEE